MSKDIKLTEGHKLIYKSGDLWEFKPAEDWMPVQLTYGEQHQIIALDAPGMMLPLMLGNPVHEFKIMSIVEVDGKFDVLMKKRLKNYISELERGDLLYVVTPNHFGADINRYVFDSIIDESTFDSDRFTNTFAGVNVYSENDESKTQKHIIFSKQRIDEDMNSKEGMKIGVTYDINKTLYEKMFTNVDHAKAYGYDICQDMIEKIRTKQSELMNKY